MTEEKTIKASDLASLTSMKADLLGMNKEKIKSQMVEEGDMCKLSRIAVLPLMSVSLLIEQLQTLPADAKVQMVYHDTERARSVMQIQSSSFESVEEGAEVPFIKFKIDSKTGKLEKFKEAEDFFDALKDL